MAVTLGSAYFERASTLDPGHELVEDIRRAKTSVVRDLSHSATYWVGLFQEAARSSAEAATPTTMLREVDFDASEDERVGRVRFRSIDESSDLTW
jgi:tartrate dehydratase beta subunit/fumarate hydratase class I family protein